MAASLGSYVDDLPGLSPEELERALAATETAPAPVAPTPAEMEGAAAAAAAPEAPALAAPEVLDPWDAAAGAPPAPAIQRSTAQGFKAQQRDYQDQEIADANKRLDLLDRTGKETAATHNKAAGLRREQSDEAKGHYEQAKADADAHRKKSLEYEKKSDETFAEAEKNKSPPDASVMQKVMGVLAGLAALGGHSSGAQGLQLIGSLFAPDRDKWERERKANSELYQMATRGVDMNNASEEQDYTVASRADAANAVQVDRAIDAVMEEGLGEEGLRAAEKLKLDVKQHARERQTHFLEQEEAARLKAEADAAAARARAAKAKRAGELSRKKQWFWARSLEELDAMPNDVLGEEGQKIRTEMRKAKQSGEAGDLENLGRKKKLEDEVLKGDGLGREGDLTPTGRAVKDPKVYNQLSVTEKSKLAEADDAATSLSGNIDKLLELRAKHGFKVGMPGTDEYNTAEVLNKKIHLAMKKADTLGTLDKGSVEFLESMTGDPNSWFGAPEAKLKAIKGSVREDVESRAERAGLTAPSAQAKTFEEGTAGLKRGPLGRGSAGEAVTLVNPQGKSFKVHPSRAAALRAEGWSDPAVAGGAFIAQPADLFAQGGGRE